MRWKLFLVVGMIGVMLSAYWSSADAPGGALPNLIIWANNGADKVTRDELRAAANPQAVINRVWNGQKITLFGARNEVVAFNLVIESPSQTAASVSVAFDSLTGPGGSTIGSKSVTGDGVFNWVGRNIELLYVQYLQIRGISTDLFYDNYDERHIPERFRRPWTGDGEGSGTWTDRPDHDKYYPEIAVPLELNPLFTIAVGTNQSIWADIYIPKGSPSGTYSGTLTVKAAGAAVRHIPVELRVLGFTLPDVPTGKTMLIFSSENINDRYLGQSTVVKGDPLYATSNLLVDRHFQVAHRHKISLIGNPDGYTSIADMGDAWESRLNGNLFKAARGYDGPGVGAGNNVYAIGEYGQWPWRNGTRNDMWHNANLWVNWFESKGFPTPTDYFLYLIDESDDFPQIETWSQWINSNPGSGSRLKSLATIDLPTAAQHTPSLDIPTSWASIGITSDWQQAAASYLQKKDKLFYLYNGNRPACGSFATEDEGISPRAMAWAQFKLGIHRWFYWESTYYDNYQGGEGQTNVFAKAHTYGSHDTNDTVLGQTGWNYLNGDGVLFYPGKDTRFPGYSYNVMGPFASLRLKHWRRGLQDIDYLTLAAMKDSGRVEKIVKRMMPKAVWEYGVEDESDPTWVLTDISWSINPDDWEYARAELAGIITAPPPPTNQAKGLPWMLLLVR